MLGTIVTRIVTCIVTVSFPMLQADLRANEPESNRTWARIACDEMHTRCITNRL